MTTHNIIEPSPRLVDFIKDQINSNLTFHLDNTKELRLEIRRYLSIFLLIGSALFSFGTKSLLADGPSYHQILSLITGTHILLCAFYLTAKTMLPGAYPAPGNEPRNLITDDYLVTLESSAILAELEGTQATIARIKEINITKGKHLRQAILAAIIGPLTFLLLFTALLFAS